MKCEKCGDGMIIVKLVPRLGRKVMGKQYLKVKCENLKCPQYGEEKYVKPSEYFKKT